MFLIILYKRHHLNLIFIIRKDINMKKYKKLMSILLVVGLFLSGVAPLAAEERQLPKEEIVYALLDVDGTTKDIYVVNIVQPNSDGKIIDYGDYSTVKNMTSEDEIVLSEGQVTINTEEKELYYQGNMISKDLPWDFNIKYYLDGEEQTDNIAGKSGELEIIIEISKNNRVEPSIQKNMTLQVEVTLDTNICKNIVAEGGTIANSGSKKTIVYTVSPGTEKSYAIQSNVSDFEMESIMMNGIPFEMDIDIETESLVGEFSDITDAIQSINRGAKALNDGIDSVYTTFEKDIILNSNTLSMSSSLLVEGVTSLTGGANELEVAANDLNRGTTALNDNINLLYEQIVFLEENIKLIDSDNEDIRVLQSQIGQLSAAALMLASASKEIDEGSGLLYTGLVGFNEYSEALNNQLNTFDEGMQGFDEGLTLLSNGIETLNEGSLELSEGTENLVEKTNDLDVQVGNQIDGLIEGFVGNSDEIVSFSSTKNTSLSNLQFIIKTSPIKLETKVNEPVAETKLNFLQKILRLFGLYS
jgi:hypothetical protein